ncbi:hypothetical protein ANN_07922 [Periplaneta americana]|uniref:Uncharacterized protein n=1 Tax=Periplaneta americana TaxID=6978 RepID=A0ABQ8SZZ1_PERAM|nr:hypothetical protein ANN_07922 [Periplaneta americana]
MLDGHWLHTLDEISFQRSFHNADSGLMPWTKTLRRGILNKRTGYLERLIRTFTFQEQERDEDETQMPPGCGERPEEIAGNMKLSINMEEDKHVTIVRPSKTRLRGVRRSSLRCLDADGGNRRADIAAINRPAKRSLLLDPTVRFQENVDQTLRGSAEEGTILYQRFYADRSQVVMSRRLNDGSAERSSRGTYAVEGEVGPVCIGKRVRTCPYAGVRPLAARQQILLDRHWGGDRFP